MACAHRVTQGNNDIIPTCWAHNFAPDWCSGLFKQQFRQIKINTLDYIANAITTSSIINHPQIVGTLNGRCLVLTYSRSKCFEGHTKKLHLELSSRCNTLGSRTYNSPSSVFVRKSKNDVEKEIKLLSSPPWHPSYNELPDVNVPPGFRLKDSSICMRKSENFAQKKALTLYAHSQCNYYPNNCNCI